MFAKDDWQKFRNEAKTAFTEGDYDKAQAAAAIASAAATMVVAQEVERVREHLTEQ